MKKDECEKWKYGNTYKDTITKKTSFLFQLFISFLSFQNIHHAWKQYERHRRNARSRIESMKRNDFMMQSILHDIDFILLLMNCTFCTLHDVCLIMKNNERAVQNDIVNSSPNCDDTLSVYNHDQWWKDHDQRNDLMKLNESERCTRSHLHYSEHLTSLRALTAAFSESKSRKTKKSEKHDAESPNATRMTQKNRSRVNVRLHNSRREQRSLDANESSCVLTACNIWSICFVRLKNQNRSRFYRLSTIDNEDNHCTWILLAYSNRSPTWENPVRWTCRKRKISCK